MKRLDWRDAGATALVLVWAAAIGWPRCLDHIDMSDEGFLLVGATRVLAGDVPNRDFVSYQPPLSFYLLALAFKSFGTTVAVERAVGLTCYMAIGVLVFGIARQVASRSIALVVAAAALLVGMPYCNFTPFASWQGAVASLAGIFATCRAIATGRRRWSFLAGLACASALLLRHDQGLYLILAIVAVALVPSCMALSRDQRHAMRRHLKIMIGTATLVLAPWAIVWWKAGALPFMWRQLVVFLLTGYSATSAISLPRPSLSASLPELATVAAHYLPPMIALGTLLHCWIRWRKQGADLDGQLRLLLASFCLFFYCQALTRADLHHLLLTVPAALCCLACPLESAGATVRGLLPQSIAHGSTRAVALATAGSLTALFFSNQAPVLAKAIEFPARPLAIRRAGIRLFDPMAASIERAVRLVQAQVPPTQSIVCLENHAMLYFLCERRNPTRWNYLWPGDQTAEEHAQFVAQARSDPPGAILVVGMDKLRQYAPTIVQYIADEFTMVGSQDIEIYLPKSRN